MKPKSKTRWARLYTDVNRNRFHRVKFVDATEIVVVPIHYSNKLTEAKQGSPYECVLARGIMAAVRDNPTLFPHPAHYAHVLQHESIYIVDKMDGVPVHAVRYRHTFDHLTWTFDNITKAQFYKAFDKTGFNLHLRPPRNQGGKEADGARETRERKSRKADPNLANRVSRGAYRRALDAGIVLPEMMDEREDA
jgi:hypothetical protein